MRILVVEDEALIRLGMVSTLEEAGFETDEAPDADAAILVLKSRADIALVVTDINMRGSMDGLKLAHFVRSNWPTIQVIVISGMMPAQLAPMPSSMRFLSKPYQEAHFIQAVREMTQSGEGKGK